MPSAKQLNLRIQSREEEIYNGPIKSLTSKNDKGMFDVLKGHSNFISLVDDLLIIRELDGQTKEISINSGVIKVEGDNIEIYSGVK